MPESRDQPATNPEADDPVAGAWPNDRETLQPGPSVVSSTDETILTGPPAFLANRPACDAARDAGGSDLEDIPPEIGGYRLVRRLGRGGMGDVWEAEQRSPRRRVALKLVRPDLLSLAMRRRLNIEAEALGRLTHDGIARVYEAGLDPKSGRPFYAMELVSGEKLDDWVARAQPSLSRRLEVFIEICRAVHHAHQRGVVHRDLKPGNVLVTGEREVKILDFGLAHLTDAETTLLTRETRAGEVVGTLAYMSPEQAAGETSGIDALCDVYALGVIGYELLTGKLPLDVRGKPLPAAVRTIVEQEPSRLSRVDTSLRGDLETIIAKAMAKEKRQRYPSAGALADDVRRYLEYEPIAARPPSTWYHLRRFARRNKALTAGLCVAVTALLLGLGGTSFGFYRADQQRDAAELQRHLAEARAAEAEEVVAFLEDMLANISPTRARGRDTTLLREIADRAIARLDTGLADLPLARFRLMKVLAGVEHALGEAEHSAELYDRALRLGEANLPADDPDLLELRIRRAYLPTLVGEYDRAANDLRGVADEVREALGDDHRVLGEALHTFARAAHRVWRLDEAIPAEREAARILGEAYGPFAPRAIRARAHLAQMLQRSGQMEESGQILAELVSWTEQNQEGNEDLAIEIFHFNAGFLRLHDRLDEALAYEQRALDLTRQLNGDRHIDTAIAIFNVAMAYASKEDLERAEQLMREAATVFQETAGDDHPQYHKTRAELAHILYRRGQTEPAVTMMREALAGLRRRLGDDNIDTRFTAAVFAGLLAKTGRSDEAEALVAELDLRLGGHSTPPANADADAQPDADPDAGQVAAQ